MDGARGVDMCPGQELMDAGRGSGAPSLQYWLRGLDIEVAEPSPPVLVGAFVGSASAYAVVMRMLVHDV